MDFDFVILVGLALVPGVAAALIAILAWRRSRMRKHLDE
jgi:hypothetical protein